MLNIYDICTYLARGIFIHGDFEPLPKGDFFQKVRCVCQVSNKDIPNHYPEL